MSSSGTDLSGLPIRGLFFWQETTRTHVLTRISEKTDFRPALVTTTSFAQAKNLNPNHKVGVVGRCLKQSTIMTCSF